MSLAVSGTAQADDEPGKIAERRGVSADLFLFLCFFFLGGGAVTEQVTADAASDRQIADHAAPMGDRPLAVDEYTSGPAQTCVKIMPCDETRVVLAGGPTSCRVGDEGADRPKTIFVSRALAGATGRRTPSVPDVIGFLDTPATTVRPNDRETRKQVSHATDDAATQTADHRARVPQSAGGGCRPVAAHALPIVLNNGRMKASGVQFARPICSRAGDRTSSPAPGPGRG